MAKVINKIERRETGFDLIDVGELFLYKGEVYLKGTQYVKFDEGITHEHYYGVNLASGDITFGKDLNEEPVVPLLNSMIVVKTYDDREYRGLY